MKKLLMSSVLALTAVTGVHAQSVVSLSFTTSPWVDFLAAPQNGVLSRPGFCGTKGQCAQTVSFNTESGGKLTITASDAYVDNEALVYVSNERNAGLGVVTGSYLKNGSFKVADSYASLTVSSKREKLIFSFENEVSIERMVMFPNDRGSSGSSNILTELDWFDGFTVSVDGGPFVEYTFPQGSLVRFCKPTSSAKGAPTVCAPLVGKTFAFSYANKTSPERYYIGGMEFKPTVDMSID